MLYTPGASLDRIIRYLLDQLRGAGTAAYPWRDDMLPSAGDSVATLTYAPYSGVVLVFVNGVLLKPSQFTRSGKTVTLNTPATSGDAWGFYYETTDAGAAAGGGGAGTTSTPIALVGSAGHTRTTDPGRVRFPSGVGAGDVILVGALSDHANVMTGPSGTTMAWHEITFQVLSGQAAQYWWAVADGEDLSAVIARVADSAVGATAIIGTQTRVYRGANDSAPVYAWRQHADLGSATSAPDGNIAASKTGPLMAVFFDFLKSFDPATEPDWVSYAAVSPLPAVGHYRDDIYPGYHLRSSDAYMLASGSDNVSGALHETFNVSGAYWGLAVGLQT